ncbi:MAG: ABC transporter permease subunit [Nocardioides sp.]|uniref:ABC transporter permease subunit n=1 Tax=Nocardioides sp. TaxID=35761 RepID=UPI0039E640FD
MSTVTEPVGVAGGPTRARPPRTSLGSLRMGLRRRWLLLGTVAAWVVLAVVWQGKHTLEIGGTTQVGVQNWLADRALDLQSGKGALVSVTHGISDVFDTVIAWLQRLIAVPDFPSPYPMIGFLGVVGIAWFLTALWAGWRLSVLTLCCFLAFAVLGYWQDSMNLLIVTLIAVALSVIIGLPLAVWMAHSRGARAAITPVLDLMQTMPSFAYLLPLMLLFGINATAAVVCTLIYSIPPVIRISAHGLQHLPEATMEATTSMGQTSWQRLLKVELPMAKHTVIVGINQTTMAALSMATIAAFINGPGLGQPVVRALNALRVGDAFVPGLCIVLMAIMLDRVTTAASEHSERLARGQAKEKAHGRVRNLAIAGVVAAVLVYLSRYYEFAAKPWSGGVGDWVADRCQDIVNWLQDNIAAQTKSIADACTNAIINPLQNLIAGSPWFVTALAILAIALLLGGWRAGIATVICLTLLLWLRLWNDSMITLSSTIVAAAVAMILASTIGVWMGRSRRADAIIRPLLDAGQTMPPFVYLVPVLALFGPSRFTAIVAAVLYAAPAAIKIVADGIRAVSAATVEAAESAGAIAIQIITKVQIPMARSAFTVAANQGLLYVLAMVVLGGLVGGGALGYDVVAGFKQLSVQGRGLAAGFSIVLLGILLDRITTYAARRSEARAQRGES